MIQTLLVDNHVLVIVDALAYASHESFVLGDAPEYELVCHFVLFIVVIYANLWVRLSLGLSGICRLLQVHFMSNCVS